MMVDLDMSRLMLSLGKEVVIETLEIVDLDVIVEKVAGSTNVQDILAHLEQVIGLPETIVEGAIVEVLEDFEPMPHLTNPLKTMLRQGQKGVVVRLLDDGNASIKLEGHTLEERVRKEDFQKLKAEAKEEEEEEKPKEEEKPAQAGDSAQGQHQGRGRQGAVPAAVRLWHARGYCRHR